MWPFFIFLTLVLVSTWIQSLSQSSGRQEQKKVVKTTVYPTDHPKTETDYSYDRESSPKTSPSISKPSDDIRMSSNNNKITEKPHPMVTKDSVLNGIIMAELLSPPKCKRR